MGARAYADIASGLYTNFDDFNRDVQLIILHSPKNFRHVFSRLFLTLIVALSVCRFIMKPVHKEGTILAKVTDDAKCLKYMVAHTQDFKKIDQLNLRILQQTMSGRVDA